MNCFAVQLLSRHLFLNNNRLTGTISPAIDNLHLAEQIYLGQNKFNGTLPINIGDNRPNNWRFFSVYDNQLTGMLHEGMKLANAFMLDFSRNRFYGTIPNDIDSQNYTTLRLLYLDHNSLTGTIPPSLMQIKKMKGLFLNDNRKYPKADATESLRCMLIVTDYMPVLPRSLYRSGGHDPLHYRLGRKNQLANNTSPKQPIDATGSIIHL
jgi:hypothetical protein